jgi:hypothetical protein
MGNEENIIKIQNFPNEKGYEPGWVSNRLPTEDNKNNPQFGFPVPLIGPSTIPLPGILSFDPTQDDSNKFQGCIGNKDGEAQYVSFSTTAGSVGTNGSDLKVNLNFRNLLGDTSDNIGQIFNNDLSIVTSTKTETINSITTNNSIIYYPYQLFSSSDKQNLSFKKIYFIPVSDNGVITSYQVKIRNSFKKTDNTPLWDFSNTTNMTETTTEQVNIESKFIFYNNIYGPEQSKIENKSIYINTQGNITFVKDVFTGNSQNIHNSKVRISFLFSNLEVDDKTKRYMENPSDTTKNFKYSYKNLKKKNLSSTTYNSVQVTLFTQTQPELTYTDDDITLPIGTILFSYGSIPSDFTSPLIGLSNNTSVSSDDSISFDKFLDTQWLDENGYGVPKLKALLGLQYTDVTSVNSANTHFSNNNINSVQGETKTNLKLTIEDSSWGTYYSENYYFTEYYVKIIDLGEYLPSKLYVAIQSIYDFETYNENRFNYYSSIGGISDGTFNGLITDWEGYLSLDTDKLLDTSGIGNTWSNLYNSDNSSSASLNSSIHKILLRKHEVGTFDSVTGEYTDTTKTTHYLLKIIYKLQSDFASEPIQSVPLTVPALPTDEPTTSGPYHLRPIFSNLSYTERYQPWLNNTITFTIDGTKSQSKDYIYKIELYDYKGNADRKGYGFKLELSADEEVLQQVTDKLTEFPSLSFTVLKDSVKQYKLKIENDRKFPYFGVKITNSSTTDNDDLTFSRGINFTVKDNSTLTPPTLSLFLNTDEETILKWQLTKDTNTDFGSQSYTFKINFEESNTIDLTNNNTLADFFTKINTFIKYTNDNKSNDAINTYITTSVPVDKEKYSIQYNTTTTKYENMDLSTLKIEGETDNNIYFPLILPKSKRDYTTVTSNYNTEISLLNNNEKFTIYKNNKYYLDFPLGTSKREFPETIGSKTLTKLENCMVIEFNCSHVDSSKNLDITKLDFVLTPTTSATDLRYVVKLKGELKSSETSSSGISGSGAKGIDFNDLFDFDDNDLDYRDFEEDEDLFDKEFMDFINENVNRNQKKKKEENNESMILYRGTGDVGDVEEENRTVYLFSNKYIGTININSLENIEGGRIYIGFDGTPNVDSDTFEFDITINKSGSGSDEFKFNYRILYP